MASWNFSFGLSLTTFIGTLIVVSLLTPAYRDVAGTINGPTLKAAMAIEGATCGQAGVKAPGIRASYNVKCAGSFAGDDTTVELRNGTGIQNPRLALKPRV